MTLLEFVRDRIADQREQAWRERNIWLRKDAAAKDELVCEEISRAVSADRGRCRHDAAEITAGRCAYYNPDEFRVLRIIAVVYDSHPDYQQRWRPE